MDSFYIIVACVAIVLLILLLTVIGLMMKNQNRIDVYPPNQSICPDYWEVDSKGLCIANINTSAIPVINGLPSGYNFEKTLTTNEKKLLNKAIVTEDGQRNLVFDFTKNTVCDNKNWSNAYGIQWDGYSNAATC